MEAMWSQAALVWYYVRANEDSKANEAYAKLLEVFNEQDTLAKEVFQIADIYTEVGNYAKAMELAEYTLETWPESQYKLDAQKSIVKAQFENNDFSSAEQTLEELIADNSGNSQLPQILLTFGEDYYNKGLDIYRDKTPLSAKEKLKTNFKKSLTVWLRTIPALEAETITADDTISAEYYHYAGTCSRELGQYEQALKYYKLVVENWPEYEMTPGVIRFIPKIYELLRDNGTLPFEEATEIILEGYQQVIDKYPDSPSAKVAANRIKRNNNPRYLRDVLDGINSKAEGAQ